MSVTRLDSKRPPCEFCGDPAHRMPLLCPRVRAVTYGHGEMTIHFDAEPVIIALKELQESGEDTD